MEHTTESLKAHNPSIERTAKSQLRWALAAAHVERYAPAKRRRVVGALRLGALSLPAQNAKANLTALEDLSHAKPR